MLKKYLFLIVSHFSLKWVGRSFKLLWQKIQNNNKEVDFVRAEAELLAQKKQEEALLNIMYGRSKYSTYVRKWVRRSDIFSVKLDSGVIIKFTTNTDPYILRRYKKQNIYSIDELYKYMPNSSPDLDNWFRFFVDLWAGNGLNMYKGPLWWLEIKSNFRIIILTVKNFYKNFVENLPLFCFILFLIIKYTCWAIYLF